MKRTKKFVSLLLAMVMAFAMAVTAYADEPGTTPTAPTAPEGSITIKDNENVSVAGKTFNAYKILDVASYTEDVKDEEGKITTKGTVVYTVPEELKGFYSERYGIATTAGDFDYQVILKIKAETDLFAFAADVLDFVKGKVDAEGNEQNEPFKPVLDPCPTASATAGAEAEYVTITELPLGYYVVEDAGTAAPVSALILDTTKPDVTVEIKADKPGLDKKIDGNNDTDDSTTGDVSYNNAAVGDRVPYKLTTKVPDMSGYEKYYFVITDTLSKGLTFNDDVEITIGSNKLTRAYMKTEEDGSIGYYTTYRKDEVTGVESYEGKVSGDQLTFLYTVETDVNATTGETTVEIVFVDFIQYKYKNTGNGESVSGFEPGTQITVRYSATVNQDAVIGVEGNPNKAKLTYSNNPNQKVDGTPENPDKPDPKIPIGETPESETRTYVTDLKVLKVDQDGKKLTGAKFSISGEAKFVVIINEKIYEEDTEGTYYRLKDGTYTETVPVTDKSELNNSKLYDDVNTKYRKVAVIDQNTRKENIAAEGYVDSDGILHFAGLAAGTYTITEIKAPDGYNLLKAPINVTIGFEAPKDAETSTDCTWTYEWGYGENDNMVNADTVNTNQITVTNKAGNELPSTGGMGTKVFYVLGFILVAGAAVLLITKRRMSAEE